MDFFNYKDLKTNNDDDNFMTNRASIIYDDNPKLLKTKLKRELVIFYFNVVNINYFGLLLKKLKVKYNEKYYIIFLDTLSNNMLQEHDIDYIVTKIFETGNYLFIKDLLRYIDIANKYETLKKIDLEIRELSNKIVDLKGQFIDLVLEDVHHNHSKRDI